MSSDCAVNEQEELERMKRSFLRYAKSDDAMNAPERMQNPYLASLTTLRKAMGDLRQKRTNDMNIIMEALPHLHMDDGWKLAVRIDGDSYFQFSRFYAHNPILKAKKIAGAIVGADPRRCGSGRLRSRYVCVFFAVWRIEGTACGLQAKSIRNCRVDAQWRVHVQLRNQILNSCMKQWSCSMTNALVLMGRYEVKITDGGTLVLPRDRRSLLVEDGVVYVMPNLHERSLLLLRKSALDDEIARLQTQTDDPDAKTTLKSITENAKLLQCFDVFSDADRREFLAANVKPLGENFRRHFVDAKSALKGGLASDPAALIGVEGGGEIHRRTFGDAAQHTAGEMFEMAICCAK